MKRISKLYWVLTTILATAMINGEVAAQTNGFKLDNVGGTSGAGTKDLAALATKGGTTLQAFADLAIIAFAFGGLIIFGISLFGLYKAGKEERESPKGAVFGLIVGGALTSVTLLLGMSRNTFGFTG